MTTETTRDTGLAPWQDWEIGEGDVVWSYDALWQKGYAGGKPISQCTCLDVFMSADDAFHNCERCGGIDPRFERMTIAQAKDIAKGLSLKSVVLRDREGKEIDRWPV